MAEELARGGPDNNFMTMACLRIAALVCMCFFLLGCPARWVFNITNETVSPIAIEIGKATKNVKAGQTIRLPILPASEEEFHKKTIIIRSAERQVRQANAYKLFEACVKKGARYPNVYVAVSVEGIAASVNQQPND